MERNEEIQNEKVQNEEVQNAVTETGRSKKKLLIILISAVVVVLIAAAVFAIVKLNTKNNSDKNELISEQTGTDEDKDENSDGADEGKDGTEVNSDGSKTESGENTKDSEENNESEEWEDDCCADESAKELPTIDQYLADGYVEFDISSIDINSNMVENGKTLSTSVCSFDITDIDFTNDTGEHKGAEAEYYQAVRIDGLTKVKVGENNYTVNFPELTDNNNTVHEELNIENVKKIYWEGYEYGYRYFLLTNDSLLVMISSYYPGFISDERFFCEDLTYDYDELFCIYSLSDTFGPHAGNYVRYSATWVGLTTSGEYKYVFTGYDFYDNWYYADYFSEILNNRSIYVKGINRDSKCLMAFGAYPNTWCSYIIDSKMNLLSYGRDTGKDVTTVLIKTASNKDDLDRYALFDSDGKMIADNLVMILK